MVFCVYALCYFFFCLEATLGKDTQMGATSATVMIIFSKVLFRKLLDQNYVKGTLMQVENLPICLRSYENNTLKISHFLF